MLAAPASPRLGTKRMALPRPMASSMGMLWIDTTPGVTHAEAGQGGGDPLAHGDFLRHTLFTPGWPAAEQW